MNFGLEHIKSLGIKLDIKSVSSAQSPDGVLISHAFEKELNIHNCYVVENTDRQLSNIKSCVSCTVDQVETSRRRLLPQTPIPATAQRPVTTTPQATLPTPSLQDERILDG